MSEAEKMIGGLYDKDCSEEAIPMDREQAMRTSSGGGKCCDCCDCADCSCDCKC